jgi:PAT family beta-lactamase induction signal transducer AmpG
MLYMMQQISPGKYHMSHYAFANSLMNLTLVPTQMISGPLADHFGYKTYFIIVMFAAIPSLLGAWFAPFPRKFASHRTADELTPNPA